MVDPGQSGGTARPLDVAALARTLGRLQGAASAPWLHGEVARRMADRLAILKHQPAAYIDWWSHVGGSRDLLRLAHPGAQAIRVEPDDSRRKATELATAAAWWSPRRWASRHDLAVLEEGVAAGSGALLWANMMLHGSIDPQAVMKRWHRALAVDGFLMFSTLGPGTLKRLADLYRAQGWPPPHAPFVDMHDLGDMLVASGFADPVMDQETLTLTWTTAAAMRAELRSLGANIDPARYPGLRTPRWRTRLEQALAAGGAGGFSLEFEIVYGHAVRPPPRPAVASTTTVALDDMRAMVRARPRR